MDGASGIQVLQGARAFAPEIKPLIYEGVSELAQEAHLPGIYLPFPVGDEDGVYHVRSEDGDVVGILCYNNFEAEITISMIYVEPSSRRRGIATAMWMMLLHQWTHTHDHLFRICVHPENKLMQEVLGKWGFQKSFGPWLRVGKGRKG